MADSIKPGKLKRNLVISISVQIVSLVVNMILNLVLPKFIDEFQYAYWQTYFLYVGYVGILHFGLLDGIVLRYSQYDYDEIDRPRIRSQFQILLLINSIMTILVTAISILFASGDNKYIFIFVACGIITKNIYTYSSYTFQITNRIDKYAILVVSMRVFYGILVVILLGLKVNDFRWYCVADLTSDMLGVFIGSLFNKGLYFGKILPLRKSLKEFKLNITSGIMLLISNWTANLQVGNAKMIIQWRWNQLTFGKITFAFSVSALFLTFVNAISVVLFPSLKRMELNQLPSLYMKIRNIVSPLMFVAMLFYFPGCWLLKLWIPKYEYSLVYLGILLPTVVFSSKVVLLTNNYLKAYRKEKEMLLINVVSVVISFVFFAFASYIINNLNAVLITVVFALMMRSVVSEIIVMKIIKIKMIKDFVIELIMTVLFIICTKYFNSIIGFIIYLLILTMYLLYYRNNIKSFFVKRRKI